MTDDEVLIKRIAAGDQPALEEIVRRHQGRVFNLIVRFLRQPQTAEELTQEVFFMVWQHAGRFRGGSRFSTWLYRIAVNLCLDHRQQEKTNTGASSSLSAGDEDSAAGRADDRAIPPDQILERQESRKLVQDAVGRLPGQQRLAIILNRFEGRSYREIAELMGLSLPAVESLLFRAKGNLLKMLTPLKEKGQL